MDRECSGAFTDATVAGSKPPVGAARTLVLFSVHSMSAWDQLQVRVHGNADRPTLIYLPGLHGDWTLVSSFRVALGARVRFVEFTYPRTLTWTLEDHARAVLDKLAAHGIREGWILAESFSSVVAWGVLERAAAAGFAVRGVVLSGGFVRYPYPPMVRLARVLNRVIPL